MLIRYKNTKPKDRISLIAELWSFALMEAAICAGV